MAALSLVIAVSSTDTDAVADGHPRAKAISSVSMRSVPSCAFACSVAAVRTEAGWSYEQLGRLLGVTKGDAFRVCNGGKATAEQLATVMARAPRRAA
jgi:hypothetical protein